MESIIIPSYLVGAVMFFLLGGLLSHRSRRVKIIALVVGAIIPIVLLTLFWSIMVGVAYFYAVDRRSICFEADFPPDSPQCESRLEDYRATYTPSFILWYLVPDVFRPPCDNFPPGYCQYARFASTGWMSWLSIIGPLISIGMMRWGMWQFRRDE